MPNENLLNSLDFTRSAGGLSQGDSDDTFADVISSEQPPLCRHRLTHCDVFTLAAGGFPSKQKISKLQKIEIFQSDGTAVIVGLKVTYLVDSQAVTVNHGIVGGVTNVGTLEIGGNVSTISEGYPSDFSSANQLLVGASGRFKNTADETKNGRISFIVFSVFDNETGYTTVTGQETSTPSKLCEH